MKGTQTPYEKVRTALEESIKKYSSTRVGILFSGGVDSSLMAVLLPNASLYSVVVRECGDATHLERCKKIFSNLRVRVLDPDEVIGLSLIHI